MLRRIGALLPLLLLLTPRAARADVVVLRHEFTAEEAATAGADFGQRDGEAWLVFRGGSETPKHLITLPVSDVPHPVVELRGMMLGRDVSPAAAIVVWLDYGEGHRYSVATDGAGDFASASGTFEARPFRIPYVGREGDTLRSVEVTLDLPGRGVVAVGPLRLVALDGPWLPARMRPWFEDAAVWPLFMPVGLGLLGTLLFVGLLGAIGRLRSLALLLLRLGVSSGALTLVAGGVGMGRHQPPEVYLPLLVAGGVTLVFALLTYGPTVKRFDTAEAKRG